MIGRAFGALSFAALVFMFIGGCTRDDTRAEVVVFAAASLTEAFAELERDFEQAHPGVDVRLAFAGSQILRLQIEQGARVDVFASADEAHLQALADTGRVARRATLTENALVVIVPRGSSAIARFDQLDKAGRIVVGTRTVPIGRYTRRVFEAARTSLGAPFVDAVTGRIVSEEANTRLVRAKVELGEADAAIVYRTDAQGSGRVRTVPIPDALAVRARYPIAVLDDAPQSELAHRFVDHALSPSGQAVLARHGFEPASAP